METESQFDRPVDKPQQAALPVEQDDTLPLTVDEFKDAGREVLEQVKHGFLVPAYKLGRRYIRSIKGAADEFIEGVANDRKKGD